jgi:hypothetical protein
MPQHAAAARLTSSLLRQAWMCGGGGSPWWTTCLLVLCEAPPLWPGPPRRSGVTSASVEWHDRPRPGGATSTSSRRRDLDRVPERDLDPARWPRALPRPGGSDLNLVPATTTSTAARRCDLDPTRCPRPWCSLDDALHRRLAAYLTVPLPTGLAWRRGRWRGSPACEGVDGTDSTTMSRQRR